MKSSSDEEKARERSLEKTMFKIWLNASEETNERNIEHLKNCVRVAISECLAPKQKRYLILYLNGYNQKEIAEFCGVNKSTVSRIINSAMDRLFDHIKYATPATLHVEKRVRKCLTRLYK